MSILIHGLEQQRQSIVRCARSAAPGRPVTTTTTLDELTARAAEQQLAFVDGQDAAPVLEILRSTQSRARVVLIDRKVETHVLRLAIASARVVGVLACDSGHPAPWEINYITRRVVSTTDPIPWVSDMVPWGSTNISWTPKTTRDLRRIVEQIEGMAKTLGCERRESTTVSTAAHELLMNAMYDAPVDDSGKPIYALQRSREIELPDHMAPRFRFTLGSDYLGLDASDPFGRLPRNRFFEGVLRGHLNMIGAEAPLLDTSHGGAGLGLHTLYSSGTILRAELHPLKRTHVSWMLRRHGTEGPSTRSLYFAPVKVTE